MAVSFKIPAGVTDKTIEATLDKLQNAITKFGTSVDAQSVEMENKNELLNRLASELYTFDIQLQEFKDNFSAGTESKVDDEEAANVRAQLAEFQNKLVTNKFSIEEANTLITDLATFFGNAVDIFAEEVPEGEATEQTIAERNKEAEEAVGEMRESFEEIESPEIEEAVRKFGDSIEELNSSLEVLNVSINNYMATDPGAGNVWVVPAGVTNKLVKDLESLLKALDKFVKSSEEIVKYSRGNRIVESLPGTATELYGSVQAILSMTAAVPEAEEVEKPPAEDLDEFFASINEAISNFDRALYNIDTALDYSNKQIESYTGSMPEEAGKVWIVDELAEKEILRWLNEIIENLLVVDENAKFLYQYTDENAKLEPLQNSAKYAEMLKELLAGGIDTESRKREFINSLIAIYNDLTPLIKEAYESKGEIYKEIDTNIKKGESTDTAVTYDQRLEFILAAGDIAKDVGELVISVGTNIEDIVKDLKAGAEAKVTSEKGREAREVKKTTVEKKERAQILTKALNKGIDDFSKMRKGLQTFVNDITKKPIDFKKLGDEISDITTDYSGLVSNGIEIYGNILNGNFDYDTIGKVMDQYRAALVDIVADFPEFVRSKLTGAELRNIGKGLLKGFGGIMGSLFGKSATKTQVGIATSAGYYVVPILFALQIFITS